MLLVKRVHEAFCINVFNSEQRRLCHTWVRMGLLSLKTTVSLLLTWCEGKINPLSLQINKSLRETRISPKMVISTLHFAGSAWTASPLVQFMIAGNSGKNRKWELLLFKTWCLQDLWVTQEVEWMSEEWISQIILSAVMCIPASLSANSDKPDPSRAGNRLTEPRHSSCWVFLHCLEELSHCADPFSNIWCPDHDPDALPSEKAQGGGQGWDLSHLSLQHREPIPSYFYLNRYAPDCNRILKTL